MLALWFNLVLIIDHWSLLVDKNNTACFLAGLQTSNRIKHKWEISSAAFECNEPTHCSEHWTVTDNRWSNWCSLEVRLTVLDFFSSDETYFQNSVPVKIVLWLKKFVFEVEQKKLWLHQCRFKEVLFSIMLMTRCFYDLSRIVDE